jgi:hypothetical protein
MVALSTVDEGGKTLTYVGESGILLFHALVSVLDRLQISRESASGGLLGS